MEYKEILSIIEDMLFTRRIMIEHYRKEIEELKAENAELKKDNEVLESRLQVDSNA